jgi:hypothetical protein
MLFSLRKIIILKEGNKEQPRSMLFQAWETQSMDFQAKV